MKETKASPYLKHLQKNALFYLQMLAMLLLVLALLQPFWKTEALAGEQVIFLVDTSATMETSVEGESLLEIHKKEMLQLTEQLSDKPFTLITTGNQPKVVVRQSTDIQEIKEAIEKLALTYEEENMPKSLDFAQSFFQQKATSVYVFTDRLDKQALPLQYENVTWNVRGLQAEVTNLSIKRFGATKTNNGIAALIQIENQSDKEQTTTLIISNEEKEVKREKVTIAANETTTLSFDDLASSSYLKAKIESADSYALDNEIPIYMAEQLSNVYVDGSLHSLVRTAFQSLDINVSTVPTEQINMIDEDGVLVTNQFSSIDQIKNPSLFIGRNDEIAKEASGSVSMEEHSLFSFADLSNIYVDSIYPSIEGYTTIARVGEDPFIQLSPRGDIVVLSDIQMTDWPLSPSFPLFMWSVKEQLSNGNSYLGTFSPNERRPLSLGGSNEWEIYTMDDSYEYSIENGGAFVAPKKPGLYVLRSGGEERSFSVAISQNEKTIAKGSSYTIGGAEVDQQKAYEEKSFVPYLLIVLLVLFVIEWEVQRRRGFTS